MTNKKRLNESYDSKYRKIVNHIKKIMPKEIRWSYDDYRVIGDDLGGGIRFQVEFDSKDSSLQKRIMDSIENYFYGVHCDTGWGRDWDYYISVNVDEKACNESLDKSNKLALNENIFEDVTDPHQILDEILKSNGSKLIESLSHRERQVIAKALVDADDKEAREIIDDIYFYDEKLFNRFTELEKDGYSAAAAAKIISDELSLSEDVQLDEKVAPDDYAPKQSGTAYKVFKVRNGKLYPPMVANAGGEDTPIGKWLEAEEGEFAGLSKTGRKQVKAIGGGNLSYRPGWHLGEVPRAPQFDRTNKQTGEKEFPKDFVWARCSYTMDIDYQPESDEQGYMRTKVDDQGNVTEYRSDKYQHSLAGLHKLPKDGYYKYRTNPRPDTVPWIITGAIKVDELLDDYQVNEILKKNGIEPIHRQGGDKTLKELGL